MRCNKHPKYKGILQPRVLCATCWAIWLGMCETCINCGCLEQDDLEAGYVVQITEKGARRIR